jgi:hypothetical protein
MGYLSNNELIVDAILTKKGRERLAAGLGLNITQFALADDEIDYTLYEPAHPLGSAYYDAAIKNIPVLEATPDESQLMKYKLVTLPESTLKIPSISISGFGGSSITFGRTTTTPVQINVTTNGFSETNGYTAILGNRQLGTLIGSGVGASNPVPVTAGTANAQVAQGTSFQFYAEPGLTLSTEYTTTITIYGNTTGANITIPVVINYTA